MVFTIASSGPISVCATHFLPIQYSFLCLSHPTLFCFDLILSSWTSQYLMFNESHDHGNVSALLFKEMYVETWPLNFHRKKPVKNKSVIFVKIHWFLKLVTWCFGIWVIISKPVMFFSMRFCSFKGDDSCWFFSYLCFLIQPCVLGQTKCCGWRELIRILAILPREETM